MIYITGDTHGGHDFCKLDCFANENPHLTKDDYLIIAGDFGGVWEKEMLSLSLSIYEDLPFTVLFVDGNHENFDLLDSYPVEMWNGGKIHRVSETVIHLMRGQVFKIDGKTFFTFGGAESVDKAYRTEGKSWWKQETPCQAEYDEGICNLARIGNKVDYIITHSIDEKALRYSKLNNWAFKSYETNICLNMFEDQVEYKHWYFGHYHIDEKVAENKTALYFDIIEI